MKTFKNMAAQGDMLIRRIDALPNDVKKLNADNGNYILAHSETGHHHIIKEDDGIEYYSHANDNFIAYLVVNNETCVEHMRGFDTHEKIKIDKGVYEIRRQREYMPEGFRRAQD